jgi:hypothetical protein
MTTGAGRGDLEEEIILNTLRLVVLLEELGPMSRFIKGNQRVEE